LLLNYKGRREHRDLKEGSASEQQDPLTYQIIAAAIEVHKRIGAGLLESLYEEAFALNSNIVIYITKGRNRSKSAIADVK